MLHDINLVSQYTDQLVCMKGGRTVAAGSPRETRTAERLRDVYDIRARIDGQRVDIEDAT